jgi:hypothetical protein
MKSVPYLVRKKRLENYDYKESDLKNDLKRGCTLITYSENQPQ